MSVSKHGHKRDAFVTYFEKVINESPKTQVDIARAIGFENPNMITMIKRGHTRLPLDKVKLLADVLDIDPPELYRRWFDAYTPDMLPVIELYMGPLISSNEAGWIRNLRKTLGFVPPYHSSWSEAITKIVKP